MGGYLRFTKTGNAAVDKILGALEYAGDGQHHTEGWGDEPSPGRPSYIDVIQDAANKAADADRSHLQRMCDFVMDAGYITGGADTLEELLAYFKVQLNEQSALLLSAKAAIERGRDEFSEQALKRLDTADAHAVVRDAIKESITYYGSAAMNHARAEISLAEITATDAISAVVKFLKSTPAPKVG